MDSRWNAIIAGPVTSTELPIAFGGEQVGELRAAGPDDLAIVDVLSGSASLLRRHPVASATARRCNATFVRQRKSEGRHHTTRGAA